MREVEVRSDVGRVRLRVKVTVKDYCKPHMWGSFDRNLLALGLIGLTAFAEWTRFCGFLWVETEKATRVLPHDPVRNIDAIQEIVLLLRDTISSTTKRYYL